MVAVADEAIRQIRQTVLRDEATCDPSCALGIWNPQKCAACAVVAARSMAMHTTVSHAAEFVCVRRVLTALLSLGCSNPAAEWL